MPLAGGAVQVTLAEAFPATAWTPVGAPGTVTGVTELDGVDVDPVPLALVAWTRKVYLSPLANPVTVHDVPVPPAVQVFFVGVLVTVYPVIGEPPVEGAFQATVAEPAWAVATTVVGFPGTDPVEAPLVPIAAIWVARVMSATTATRAAAPTFLGERRIPLRVEPIVGASTICPLALGLKAAV